MVGGMENPAERRVVTSGKFITATGGPTEKYEASQSVAEISPTAFSW